MVCKNVTFLLSDLFNSLLIQYLLLLFFAFYLTIVIESISPVLHEVFQ